MPVHPTAFVAEGAELGADVDIGPFCVVGPRVRLGDGCRLHSHVVIEGDTHLGRECQIWPHVVLGGAPQHRDPDPDGVAGRLRIGDRNRFREAVTVHVGSARDQRLTTIGDDNMFLAASHVAHDATIGNSIVMTNCAMAAGHTQIDDHAVLGAMVGVHQFCRVGKMAMLGAGAMVSRDAPPYALIHGDRARIRGVNAIGLRRAGHHDDDVATVKRAYRRLFWRGERLIDRLARVQEEWGDHPLVAEILVFMHGSKRGIMMSRHSSEHAEGAD